LTARSGTVRTLMAIEVLDEVWKWLYTVVDEVGDDIGEERNGPWLLCYEGWGGFCVDPVWDPARSDDENEEAAYEYARANSSAVIDEWVEERAAGFDLAESGHEPTGLYGVTWALFREKGVSP